MAYIAIGYSCNQHCIFCPCSSDTPKNKRLTVEQIADIVEKGISEKGLNYVLLSGGEPTIQPHFFEVLEYLAQTDIPLIGMLSNSEKLHDKTMVDKIVSIIPPSRFEVTTALHSHISEKHDYVTRSKGSFSRSLEGLKNAADTGIRVVVKHIVTRFNYSEMEDFIDFVYSNFSDSVLLNLCSLDYCGIAGDNKDTIAVRFDQSGPYLERALDKVIEYRKNGSKRYVVVNATPLCAVDPYYWSFFSYISKENLAARGMPSNSDSVLKLDVESDCGTFFRSCKLCDVESICSGTWRTACELFGDNAVSPIRAKSS